MKATPSRDNELRFTIWIKARVGRIDLIHSLIRRSDRRGEPLPTTRRQALKVASEEIAATGDALWTEVENLPVELFIEAAARVDKLFPELKKPVDS